MTNYRGEKAVKLVRKSREGKWNFLRVSGGPNYPGFELSRLNLQ